MPDYTRPDRVCDLIMKGGVTSGVVYPPAIGAIAERFWLSGIGGTSAGAIAAALAAAAEYRRRTANAGDGYDKVAAIPDLISGPGKLLSLFKPDAPTRKIFDFVRRTQQDLKGGWLKRTRAYAGIAQYLLSDSSLQPLVDNHMGLCSGMANGQAAGPNELPALTRWLDTRLNDIAGLPPGRPLTFGDLFHAPPIPGLVDPPAESIRLQLISTCLTFGRPYTLPYLDRRFAFRESELRPLFPAPVADYLVQAARGIAATMNPPPPDGLLPLPVGEAMPVIVAVRMSLSFPVLFSAVPLYYRNFDSAQHDYERVYFADGGITSNLPVQFFDSPLPRWPTLAINLQYAKIAKLYDRPGVDRGVWMTPTPSAGTLDLFNDFLTAPSPLHKLIGLAGAIFRSAQTWNDNSFLTLPGYRDRMAEIWLEPDEGGFNLDMSADTINAIKHKGDEAGRRLVQRFADAPVTEPLSWDGHRWTRYRLEMAALAEHLRRLEHAATHPQAADRPLADLLAGPDTVPVHRFADDGPLTADQLRESARRSTEALLAYARTLGVAGDCQATFDRTAHPFCHGPRPPVQLQAHADATATVPHDD